MIILKNKKLIAVIIFLVAATLILVYINMRNIDTSAGEDKTITVIWGESSVKLQFDELISLDNKEFNATEDTSKSGPASRRYKGVLLKDLLNKASVDDLAIKGYSKVLVKGLDGYVIALSVDEILSGNNVFIAFEKDGKPLGTMKKGGSGPFQLIARSDMFSQRWCKYVYEVVLE